MYRIKISSKAIRKNQIKFAKMAQKAINLSDAFDNHKLYKDSSDFYKIAEAYSRFILAEDVDKEEENPVEDIPLEDIYASNLHPELVQLYSEHNFGKEPFGSTIFSRVGIPNIDLVNQFYNSLVRNNGSYVALIREMRDYKIKPDTGFFMEDQTITSLRFALAKYFKNNNYFTSDDAKKIYNLYFYRDGENYKIQLQSDSENQQKTYNNLQILREFFADTMQVNRKVAESAISFILQNNYPFKAEDILDESKKESLQQLKDNLILVLSFAFDRYSNPKLMNLNFELFQRLKFIERKGVDNYIALLQKADEKKSPISFSDGTLPYYWQSFVKIKSTTESRASSQQEQRVLDFILKNESKLSEIPIMQHGGGGLLSAANYLSIYNILEKFGEEATIKILKRYSQNFNSFNNYVKTIELGMLLGVNVDEVIKILENYGSDTAIVQEIFQAVGQKTSKFLDLSFLDFLHQIYENNIDDFNLLIESIKTNEVPVEKIELVKGSLFKVLGFKPGYLKEILEYYKTWKSESDSLSFIPTFVQAKYYIGDEILKYSPEILTTATMFSGRDIKTVAENLTKYGTVDSPEPKFDSEKYEEVKEKVIADSTLNDFDERKIMLFFDGDMDYAYLASNLSMPSVNSEDATKIGMTYKNLDVKGVFSLRNFTRRYKFFPESMIQKYDTNELGVLSTIFTEDKLLIPGYAYNEDPLFDANYLNELDQKMQDAISFIDKKYPNLSKTKSANYYIILRYVLNNSISFLSDPNQLAEMLRVHSISLIDKTVEKANKFPDADVFEAFLFVRQSDAYGEKLSFDEERQQFFNKYDGIWRHKIKDYSPKELVERFSTFSNDGLVWKQASFRINSELEELKESNEDFYEFIETYKDYLIEPITSFIWNLDELESKFRPEVKEIESFSSDLEEIYSESVEMIIHGPESQLALRMLSEMDPEKADILRKLYIQYKFNIIDLEEIKIYLDNPESEIPPIVKYSYNVNFDEIKDYYRKTFAEPEDAFNTINELSNESLTNIQKIINLFGNETFKWLNKFTASKYFNPQRTKDDPENISKFEALSDVEKGKLIHDASQIIPSLKRFKNKGAKEFLLQKYTKNNDENIKTIMVNWDTEVDYIDDEKNHISYIVAQVANFKEIDVLANEIRLNTLMKIFGDNPPKEIAFAQEVAKWYRPAENNLEDDDDEDDIVENELGQDIMIFDIDKYKRLEEFYIESKQTPLPKWAQIAPVSQLNLTGRFLPREDPRGIFLGQYTACCQHPGNAAYSAAIDGTISPNACFFVVENHLGRIVGQSYVWQDLNGNICFDSFETGGAGSSIFHSIERQKAVKNILQNIVNKMGNVKVTMGSSAINITDKITTSLQNPALGLVKLYQTYGALPPIYSGDSSSQYLLSDKRSKEDATRQESENKLRTNGSEMFEYLLGNSNPKMMDINTWYENDFSDSSTINDVFRRLPQDDEDGDIVLDGDWDEDED